MSKVMLINVTHVEESRVAIVEDGVLSAYEIETTNRSNIIGNIYNAVVESVIPSIEAAFVRLGGDLKGFLPLDEVNFRLLPARGESRSKGKITQHLHSGQRLMAQVIRAPFSGKPPTVTTYFSLPGRYLVLMPGVDASGISRKIADGDKRDRLKKIIDELNLPEGFGLIVRTAGVGQTKTELHRDLRYLLRLWESIQRASGDIDFPGLVYQERDLVIRTIRDYFTPDIGEVWIDSPDTYERALAFVRDVMPNRAKTVRLYTGERPLFNKFNLEEQIESIYQRRVSLPSGGEIVIDGTEALTAIDVNTARSKSKTDAEENALQTNLEAAGEITRQLRLRDVGGLVVVDFIDMSATRNKRKVERTFRDGMKTDKARYDVTSISKLGLMEVARQRLKGAKLSASYRTCPACEGYGLVKTVETAALAALRKLQTKSLRADAGRIRMALPPEVAVWTMNQKRTELLDIERRQDLRIVVEPKASLKMHEVEFETFPREKIEEPPALVSPDRPAPPVPPDLDQLPQPAAEERASGEAPEPAVPGRRRRRRRRRGRGSYPSAPAAEPETVEPARQEGPSVAPAAPEPGEAGRGDGDDDEPSAAPRRRRRRRKRRGKSAPQEAADGAPASPSPSAEPGESNDREIPPNVSPQELMPAATGGVDSKGSGRRRGGRRRKSARG